MKISESGQNQGEFMNKPKVALALVHYPVYNKHMEIITTSITNLDIHDVARSSRTYNAQRYYLIHPVQTQQELAGDIINYWQKGFGAQYNSDRSEALGLVQIKPDIEAACRDLEELWGERPALVTTDARTYPNTISYTKMREQIWSGKPILLLFGTGWGMDEATMKKAEYILEPIYGGGEYNHLSVRSAIAIILDRLLGESWWS